jgi:ribonuclease-3
MTDTLSGKIGYVFSDPALRDMALTHSSTLNDQSDNERLEFLGDRVLGLAVANLLFTAYPDEPEGSLAKRHTGLVQQEALVNVAREIELAEHLRLSAGEMKSGGHKKEKILADALEALIGAIYKDGGLEAAEIFVTRFWGAMLQSQAEPPEDAKSLLQEWAQGRGLPLPEYKLLGKSGTDHATLFEMEVSVESIGETSAIAASKRAAEKEAAMKMLEKIGIKI